MNKIDNVITKLELFGEKKFLRLSVDSLIVDRNYSGYSMDNCILQLDDIEVYSIENGEVQRRKYNEFHYSIDEEIAVGIIYNNDTKEVFILDKDLSLVATTIMEKGESYYGITKNYFLTEISSKDVIKIYNYTNKEVRYIKDCIVVLYYNGIFITFKPDINLDAKADDMVSKEGNVINIINGDDVRRVSLRGSILFEAFGRFKYYGKEFEGIIIKQICGKDGNYMQNIFILTSQLEKIPIKQRILHKKSQLKLISTQDKIDKYNLIHEYMISSEEGSVILMNRNKNEKVYSKQPYEKEEFYYYPGYIVVE